MATFTQVQDGDWRTPATWDQGVSYPQAGDTAVMGNVGRTLTLSHAEVCSIFTDDAGGANAIVLAAGGSLHANNDVTLYSTLNGVSSANVFHAANITIQASTACHDCTLQADNAILLDTNGHLDGSVLLVGFSFVLTNSNGIWGGSQSVSNASFAGITNSVAIQGGSVTFADGVTLDSRCAVTGGSVTGGTLTIGAGVGNVNDSVSALTWLVTTTVVSSPFAFSFVNNASSEIQTEVHPHGPNAYVDVDGPNNTAIRVLSSTPYNDGANSQPATRSWQW